MTATFELDGLSVGAQKRLANGRWSLCLGAGINGPLMPDWVELTRRVVNQSNGMALDPTEFRRLVDTSRWSLDAWLQQALNRYISNSKSPEEFSEQLGDDLYSDFLAQADRVGLRAEAATLLNSPQRITKGKFDAVAEFLKDQFGDLTVYKLADLFTMIPSGSMPSAILNFNADTFFHSIFMVLKKKKHLSKTKKWEDPPDTFARVMRSSDGVGSRIPIYHLHGCILPGSPGHRKKMSDTPSAMVFPENSYTSLAGRMFSWSSSIFLYHAQADSLCFVGLSMADANIRRWLSWTFEGYSTDLSQVARPADLSGRHLWITTRPRKTDDARTTLYPLALRHLVDRL